MKKITVCLMLIVLLLCSCTTETESITNETSPPVETQEAIPPHQNLTAQAAEFDSDKDLRVSLPQIGLQDVVIQNAINDQLLDEGLYGNVLLLADDRGNFADDCYLAITTSDMVYAYDCDTAAMATEIEVRDFDGDGYSEILLQQAVDAFGGAGQFFSRVFKFKNGSFETIFSSQIDNKLIDTGFRLEVLENETFKITNSDFGYQETFKVHSEHREAFLPYMYNENGDPDFHPLWVDSFNEFKATDIDNDGVYEILGKQYSCLSYHNNWFGDCYTVWKYNNETESFEISDAWFEPRS